MADLPPSFSDTYAKNHKQKSESQNTTPACLINYCEDGRWRKGKPELIKLLQDHSMTIVWRRLGKRFNTDAEWRELWQEILYSLQKANLVSRAMERGDVLSPRGELASGLKDIAKEARSLARKLDTYRLDVLVFNCCPSDVIESEQDLNGPLAWLTVKDVLVGLANLAESREPDTGRMACKTKNHPRETEFSKRLFKYLEPKLTDRSDNIYATIAVIGAVVMGSSIITPETVKTSCRIR